MRFKYLSTQWHQCTDAQFYWTRTVRCKASSWKFATFLKQLYCASRVNDITSEEVITNSPTVHCTPTSSQAHNRSTKHEQRWRKQAPGHSSCFHYRAKVTRDCTGVSQELTWLLWVTHRWGERWGLSPPWATNGLCSRVKPRYWRLSPPPQTERASVVWESWVEQWTHPISTSEACILPSQLTRSCCLKSCIVPQHT